MNLAQLSDDQFSVKFAKHMGWKLSNGKWWHDEIGDGPMLDYLGLFGRELAEYYLSALLDNRLTTDQVAKVADQMASGAYV